MARCILKKMSSYCMKLILLMTFRPYFSSEAKCVIEFPTLDSSVMTEREGTTVTLPFLLQDTACVETHREFGISVTPTARRSEIQPSNKCWLHTFGDVCHAHVHGTICSCLPGNGRYQLEKTVDRLDSGTWQFVAESGNLKVVAEVVFNIYYPPTVTSLTLASEESDKRALEPASVVEVACTWKNGNPPVTARLLDRHREEMEGSIYSSGRIQYKFPPLKCQDGGLISCEAPGASHNESVTLLVRCPPEFLHTSEELYVVSGENMLAEFRVRMHTADVTECLIVRLQPTTIHSLQSDPDHLPMRINMVINCTSLITFTGTPPDLTLIVRLDNVRKVEEGQWRLELTNDAGTGDMNLVLHVTEKRDNMGTKTKTVVGVVGACLAVVPVVITLYVLASTGLRSKDYALQRGEEVQEQGRIEQVTHSGQNADSVDSTSNYYWEVTNESSPSETDDETPQSSFQGTDQTLTGDHLSPARSHALTGETEFAGSIIEIYENCLLLLRSRQPSNSRAPERPMGSAPDDYLTPTAINDTPVSENVPAMDYISMSQNSATAKSVSVSQNAAATNSISMSQSELDTDYTPMSLTVSVENGTPNDCNPVYRDAASRLPGDPMVCDCSLP